MTEAEYRKKTTQLRRAKTMARTALKNQCSDGFDI